MGSAGGPPLFSFVAPLFCYLGDDAAYAIGSHADQAGIRDMLRSIGPDASGALRSRRLAEALNAGALPVATDGLSNAGRVFVWHSRTETDVTDMRALAMSLLRYGPNLLLWIATDDSEHSAGMVEYVKYGLLRGFVTRSAIVDGVETPDLVSWQAMWQSACVAADALRKRGEWSYRSEQEATAARMGSIGLEKAASAIHLAESAGPVSDAGPVRLGAVGFPDARSRADVVHNAGCRLMTPLIFTQSRKSP